MSTRPRVVVVGAGFGGLAAAKSLRHVAVDVTVVDRNNYHLFQPLLYQVASGLLDPSEIAHPIRSILRRVGNARVLLAEVTAVDLDHRSVATSAGELGYDYLVLAPGSTTDFFGNEEIRHAAIGLKRLDEALILRAHLLRCFERAAVCDAGDARRRLLTVAVVGAGPTGVEYSGAVAELINHVLPKDFPELDFAETSVVLIEASGSALAGFAPRLGHAALRSLDRKRVQVRLGRSVERFSEGALVLDDGSSVPAGTVVWTAGVKAANAWLLADAVDAKGRVSVGPSLTLPGHSEVFAIGDAAAGRDAAGPLPMLAPVAIQGGRHAARVIAARLQGRADPVFRYKDKGTMATIGRGSAVAQLGPIRLSGFIAWLMWLFVHLIYLIGFRSRAIAIASWAWNFFFYDRPVRLIIEPPGDRLAEP
jgi:NADH:ubiquinone reductase (H+-translocating)